MLHLIDRRLNGRNKSAVNRERFLRRYKEHIATRCVKDMIAERSIADMDKGGARHDPAQGHGGASFGHGRGGDRETVHPGNREFVTGDSLPAPAGRRRRRGGTGPPAKARPRIVRLHALARGVPADLLRRSRAAAAGAQRARRRRARKTERAGYAKTGAPATCGGAHAVAVAGAPDRAGRNCARAGGRGGGFAAATAAGLAGDAAALHDEVAAACAPARELPFLDELDLRYRNRRHVRSRSRAR